MTAVLTWQQLRDLKRSELEDAADGWGKVSNRARGALTRVESEMSGSLTKTQRGAAAGAAVKRIDRLGRNFQYIHTECGLVRTLLNGLAGELAAPQRKLKNALQDAAALKFTVHDDGSITYPVDDKSTGKRGTEPNPLKGKAEALADDIATALRDANEIDGRYSRALGQIKAPKGLEVTDAMLADAGHDMRLARQAAKNFLSKKDIPMGKSPAVNKKWWDGLTPEERAEYKALYPDVIGAMNGIPSDARDDANRMVLAERHGQAQTDLNKLDSAEPTKYMKNPSGNYPATVINPAWQKWHDTRTRLQQQLKGMNSIQRRFDETGDRGMPRAYLLGFDTKGNGHAIVANGNPDTAQNTAVYVPGFTSRLEGAGGDINRMGNLWREAHAQDPQHSLSTVTWLGYDAPQSADVLSASDAEKGGRKLNDFMGGLQTAQGGPSASHTTVIGHSYGSTTVGSAATHGHLPADDVVVAGSPGMTTPHAKDLGVGADHVWAEKNSNDFVPDGGGIDPALTGPGDKDGVPHVPSDREFGGHRLTSDTDGHSGYWDPGSQSLKNQGAVVVDHPKQAKREW
ncbi:alpha/beta hydrolase [Streptomyces sp. NPDC050560]|uniref:alpha/beta hydrolase n=1 Tax=Streptomyces sp. NPDC050560 TaxID=3365630 RepID=UPI0037AC7DF0